MAGKVRPSKIILHKKYAEIIITDRQWNEKERTKIDLDDIDKVKDFRWHTTDKNYVRTTVVRNRKRLYIYLHRILLEPEKENDVDHINQNPLDNRKENLRIADRCINRLNSKINSNNKSGIRGISKRPNGKWQSSILVNGKTIYLAETFDKQLAINRRIKAEKKYFPEVSFNGIRNST